MDISSDSSYAGDASYAGVPALIGNTRTDPRCNLASTVDTVAKMVHLVNESLSSPLVRGTAISIIDKIGKPVECITEMDVIRGCYWWVKHHMQFITDEQSLVEEMGLQSLDDGKELLLSPAFVLEMAQMKGDCDDFSMLLACLLKALWVQNVYFCTVAANVDEPNNFSHVYCKVVISSGEQAGQIIPLDASHGSYPGWEETNVYKSADWKI